MLCGSLSKWSINGWKCNVRILQVIANVAEIINSDYFFIYWAILIVLTDYVGWSFYNKYKLFNVIFYAVWGFWSYFKGHFITNWQSCCTISHYIIPSHISLSNT